MAEARVTWRDITFIGEPLLTDNVMIDEAAMRVVQEEARRHVENMATAALYGQPRPVETEVALGGFTRSKPQACGCKVIHLCGKAES